MDDAEKQLRKDAIESTRDGWSRYVREHVKDPKRLQEALQRASNEAITLMGTMPLIELAEIYDSREQMERLAYRAAQSGPMGKHLIGETHLLN